MDPLSDVLSLLKPRSYASGGRQWRKAEERPLHLLAGIGVRPKIQLPDSQIASWATAVPGTESFNWDDLEPEDQIVRTVHAVAVYLNPHGDIVIRQECRMYGEDDQVVIVPIDACRRLISRLEMLAQEARER